MANTNKPFGLRPVRHLNGAPWNGAVQKAYVSSLYGTAVFVGDPVVWSPTLTEKDPLAKYPTINVSAGTTGLLIRGVVTAIEPSPTNLSRQYIPALTGGYVFICTDPDVVFQIQDDGSGPPAAVFVGQNAECAAGSGGSTISGLSSFVLDASTPTTTQAHNLHILGLSDIPGNELDDYAVWDVLLNTIENATGRFLGVTAA